MTEYFSAVRDIRSLPDKNHLEGYLEIQLCCENSLSHFIVFPEFIITLNNYCRSKSAAELAFSNSICCLNFIGILGNYLALTPMSIQSFTRRRSPTTAGLKKQAWHWQILISSSTLWGHLLWSGWVGQFPSPLYQPI